MGKTIQFPKKDKVDPAVKKINDMIKWTVFQEDHTILVGEFLIAGKHDFPSGRIGKKKIEHEKHKMAVDLLMSLREVLKE